MIIVLDTTAVMSDPRCSGLAWQVLVQAREAWGLRVVVPEVVVIEAVAGYQRRLQGSLVGLERWLDKQTALGLDHLASGLHEEIAKQAREYSDYLLSLFKDMGLEIAAVPDVDHRELVERAAQRRKPCDENGDGFRDTLNWLVVVALATEGDRQVVWVTANTKDFVSPDEPRLHDDLLEELGDAVGNVTWVGDLADAVLLVAERHVEGAADLKSLRERLRTDTLLAYANENALVGCRGREVSARDSGLPRLATEARLTLVSEASELDWSHAGSVDKDRHLLRFAASIDAEIMFTMPAGTTPDDTWQVIEASPVKVVCSMSKPLVAHGLMTVDNWDRPVGAEVSRVEAHADDPGRAAWTLGNARTLRDLLGDVRSPVIPPETFAAIADFQKKFVIPPETFRAMQDMRKKITIPPETFRVMQDIQKKFVIPPETFRAMQDMQKKFAIPPDTLTAVGGLQSKLVIPTEILKLIADYQKFHVVPPPSSHDSNADNPIDEASNDDDHGHPDDDHLDQPPSE